MHSHALSKSLNSRQLSLTFLVWSLALMQSHWLSCAPKEFELTSSLTFVWSQTLIQSHWLSYALKQFEVSSTLAFVWPQTLMYSHWLSCALKELELRSAAAFVWPRLKVPGGNKVLYGGLRSELQTVSHWYTIFDTEKVPLSYTFRRLKTAPLSHKYKLSASTYFESPF